MASYIYYLYNKDNKIVKVSKPITILNYKNFGLFRKFVEDMEMDINDNTVEFDLTYNKDLLNQQNSNNNIHNNMFDVLVELVNYLNDKNINKNIIDIITDEGKENTILLDIDNIFNKYTEKDKNEIVLEDKIKLFDCINNVFDFIQCDLNNQELHDNVTITNILCAYCAYYNVC